MPKQQPGDSRSGRKQPEFTSSEPASVVDRPRAPTFNGVALAGRRVAVLVSDGFEQTEFQVPVQRLRGVGAKVEVLAPDKHHFTHIRGERGGEPAVGTKGDRLITEARPSDYDALLIPGGLKSPDSMRQSQTHLAFVRAFVEAGKPIAAICHGPWLLAAIDALRGRTVTSWPGIQQDMERAGARWVDRPVVQDGSFTFARQPSDAEAFAEAFIAQIAALAPKGR